MNARQCPARRRAIVATACLLLLLALVATPAGGGESLPDEGDADSGEQLFQANCAMCHGDDATGMGGMHPALTGAVDRLSADGVAITIRKGRATTPPMPAFEDELTEGDVADLVAYLDSLPPGPRNFGPMQDGNMMDDGMTDDGMMGRMMDDGMMTGQMWLQMLVGLLLLLAVTAIIVVLVAWVARKTARSSTSAQGDGDNPRQVLDARYARGELSREDYLQARQDLSE